jgi:hypothetical protein
VLAVARGSQKLPHLLYWKASCKAKSIASQSPKARRAPFNLSNAVVVAGCARREAKSAGIALQRQLHTHGIQERLEVNDAEWRLACALSRPFVASRFGCTSGKKVAVPCLAANLLMRRNYFGYPPSMLPPAPPRSGADERGELPKATI